MKSTDIVQLVESTWQDTIAARRIPALKNLRKAILDEHLALFDCLVDVKISNIEDDSFSTVLFLVHGIQTDGSWQKLVQAELSSVPKLHVVDIGYDCVTPFQLVGPFRDKPIERVLREIRDFKRREPRARLMVIAHSFGSYIVSRILEDHPDIEFERIVLCGSIVSRSFRWDKHAKHMRHGDILNDVGTKDLYPVLATCASWGYGSSGRLGFGAGPVSDRYFPYKHSTFFDRNRRHVGRYWKPFIQSGEIKTSVWDTRKPKASSTVLILSNPIIGRSLSLLIFVYAVWFIGSWLINIGFYN